MDERAIYFAGTNNEFAINTADNEPMKKFFINSGVPTSPYVFLSKWDEEAVKKDNLVFPVIIKLSDAYASFGMGKDSKCQDIEQLKKVVNNRLETFHDTHS